MMENKQKSDQVIHFVDTIYKSSENEMKKARFEHEKFQNSCSFEINKLTENQKIFDELLLNITNIIKLSDTSIESNNNKLLILETRINEIDKRSNRNDLLRSLWVKLNNNTKLNLNKAIKQIKRLKNELYDLRTNVDNDESFVEIHPSNHNNHKLNSLLLEISQINGLHHHGLSTSLKSIVRLIQKNMKLNKKQIKIINKILKQYKRWAENFIGYLKEKEEGLNVFYEKYRNNLNIYRINANKEILILKKKAHLYSVEKNELQSIYAQQLNQVSLLKEIFKMKNEMCQEEKKKFKFQTGDL